MQKVLVTGCNGFIGSHLVEALVEMNLEVTGVDLIPYNWPDDYLPHRSKGNFREIPGDISDNRFVQKVMAESSPDTVFHLASLVGVKQCIAEPLKAIDLNFQSIRNLLEALTQSKARLIFSSTSEIYGKNPEIPWFEDSSRVLGPTSVDRWAYSSSKAVAEHMLWAAHKHLEIPVSVVRYFNVYGPRQRPDFVVAAMVHSVLTGKSIQIHGDGKQTRCFTYVQDAVAGTIATAIRDEALGDVFNIGSDMETSIQELAATVARQLPGAIMVTEQTNPAAVYPNSYEDISRRVPSVQKARKLLNWQTQTTLFEGLSSTIAWWKEILAARNLSPA